MFCSCGSSNFVNHDGGGFRCIDCHEVLQIQEKDTEYGISQSRATSKIQSARPTAEKKQPKEWCLYDGFNIILLKMVDSFVKCGASEDVKQTIFKLWVAYLNSLNVAFQRPEHLPTEEEQNPDNEDDLNFEWMSQKVEEPEGKSPDPPNVKLPFAPIKKAKKPRKRRRVEDLCSISDSELTETEIRQKMRRIKRNFSKIKVQESIQESMQESMYGSATEPDLDEVPEEETSDPSMKFSSRFWILKKIASECPDDTISVASSSRRPYRDPEVLTLHKLLSFLYAAVILNCELITSSDILRWVREGHINLYGTHQLLPPEMPLSGADSVYLGGTSASRSTGVPTSAMLRFNTARLLDMLGIPEIHLPPLFAVVAKIITDLQLPHELNTYVQELDRIVSKNTIGIPKGDSWLPVKFGMTVRNVETHAAALILIALKLTLGLDDATEYRTSEFAEKVNRILDLKSSSLLAATTDFYSESTSKTPTLFVWDEWVRFIEYRRSVLERNHVPTAIRQGSVSQMDPSLLLSYAENEGALHAIPCRKLGKLPEEISEILDNYSSQHPDRSEEETLSFQPTTLATHGLAQQLFEHDSYRFRFLEQRFEESSLAFTLNQENLAYQLKKNKTTEPHNLNVCHGPAYEDVELIDQFICVGAVSGQKRSRISDIRRRKKSQDPPAQPEKFKLKREISSACCFSDDEDDSSQLHPSLMLHLPSSIYWSRSGKFDKVTDADWEVLSSQLPTTFVWLLNLISQSIEEQPKLVYARVCSMETLIFQKYAKLLYTITDPVDLKLRLVNALRCSSQFPRSTI